MSESKVAVWDFTMDVSQGYTVEDLIKVLNNKDIFKKWTFQLEQGEKTDLLHYQGRFSLLNKSYKNPLMKLLRDNDIIVPRYLSQTVSKEHTKECFYAMKQQTRIEGPYSDVSNPPPEPKTKQLEMFLDYELRGYQKDILNWCNDFNMRKIDIIYDPVGNLGKSIFVEYLEYINACEEIPPYRSMEDIMAWVYGRPKQRMYCIDMPRGMKKDKLADFYAGIEVIKNGVAYDKRYEAKKVRFDRPRVVIFTNTLPVFELLSADRWNTWEVQKDYTLKTYEKDCDISSDSDSEYFDEKHYAKQYQKSR